ncbi:hypothetical protein POM88_029011 [Heracleum sosnowskyi]|uniref:Uncharacterized protein n=1 Tax=Heracleum sosnowskyi TaxID=360622 RepID=A0AAD8HTY1_9APIA|nr:hypothetical protein POM88_029011 [Heracleum sosnowskyi]
MLGRRPVGGGRRGGANGVGGMRDAGGVRRNGVVASRVGGSRRNGVDGSDMRGELSMDFDNETIKFNMFEMMRYPVDTETCYTLSTTGDIAQKFFELMKDDELETLISKGICFDKDGNFEVLDEVSHMYTDSMMEHCKALHGADYVECG